MKCCDYTDYPKLFIKTYWGCYDIRYTTFPNGTIITDSLDEDTQIGQNRNQFVLDYKPKYTTTRKLTNKELLLELLPVVNTTIPLVLPAKYIIQDRIRQDKRDHIEYYVNTDKKLVIVFSMNTTEEEHNKYLEFGYVEYLPLYRSNQKTYIKVLF